MSDKSTQKVLGLIKYNDYITTTFAISTIVEIKFMPASKLHSSKNLDIYSALTETELELPFIRQGISAGFPSPALDFEDVAIDLNKHLIKYLADDALRAAHSVIRKR